MYLQTLRRQELKRTRRFVLFLMCDIAQKLDESLHEHRQAFLNFAVKAEKKAGKGKTKPVYKRFRQFFDFDKELKKMKNRRKPSRFAGITKLLDREE